MVKRKGFNAYDDKEKRKVRRQNHIAKDLRSSPKYNIKRVESKKDREEKYPLDPWKELYNE